VQWLVHSYLLCIASYGLERILELMDRHCLGGYAVAETVDRELHAAHVTQSLNIAQGNVSKHSLIDVADVMQLKAKRCRSYLDCLIEHSDAMGQDLMMRLDTDGDGVCSQDEFFSCFLSEFQTAIHNVIWLFQQEQPSLNVVMQLLRESAATSTSEIDGNDANGAGGVAAAALELNHPVGHHAVVSIVDDAGMFAYLPRDRAVAAADAWQQSIATTSVGVDIDAVARDSQGGDATLVASSRTSAACVDAHISVNETTAADAIAAAISVPRAHAPPMPP
jgi:hypothetical protein